MESNWDKSFALVMKSEGGYVNDPHDNGGETNLGVTKRAWAEYLGRAINEGEMKALTLETVKPFYKKMYWDKCRCNDLPTGVDYAVFDFAVNSGVQQSIKLLQRAVGADADGVIGKETFALVDATHIDDVLESFSNQKRDFYRAIVARNPTQAKFLNGWLNRVNNVFTYAESMLT
jgi:lysozyme family protein